MSYLSKLDELGISLNDATDELEKEGVDSFSDSFEILLEAIEVK
jgi:transaldolase